MTLTVAEKANRVNEAIKQLWQEMPSRFIREGLLDFTTNASFEEKARLFDLLQTCDTKAEALASLEPVTHYGVFREQVPNSPMIKEADFFESQGGLTQDWGKRWEPIIGCSTIGEARRKIAEKYNAVLSPIYRDEV